MVSKYDNVHISWSGCCHLGEGGTGLVTAEQSDNAARHRATNHITRNENMQYLVMFSLVEYSVLCLIRVNGGM